MKINSLSNQTIHSLASQQPYGSWVQALDEDIMRLRKLIEVKDILVRAVPDGFLEVNGTTKKRFYERNKAGKRVYLSEEKMDRIEALAQRDYNEKTMREAKRLLKSLEHIRNMKNLGQYEDAFDKLTEVRKELVVPDFLSDELLEDLWDGMEYEGKGFNPDSPEFFTSKMERVRSKAEGDIGTALHRRKLLYHYEYPLLLPPLGIIHPDFTIIHPKTRQIILWEHLGRMDQEYYSRQALARLDAYMNNGYFPGINLILTHETRERPLNFKIIEMVIDAYLT